MTRGAARVSSALDFDGSGGVAGEVERLAGEGEFESGGVEALEDLEVDARLFGAELEEVGGLEPGDDADVEGPVAHFGEADARGLAFLVDELGGGEDVGEDVDALLDLLGCGAVDESDAVDLLEVGLAGDVLDGALGEFLVGDDVDGSVQAAEAGGAQSDGLDDAVASVGDDAVAEGEGLVEEEGDDAEDVGDGVLGGEGYGEGADAGAGDEG